MTTPQKPDYPNGSYIEPSNNCVVVRVAGDPGQPIPNLTPAANWSTDVRHHYSTIQSWSCDGAYLALDKVTSPTPQLLLDGRDFHGIKQLPVAVPGDARWHPTEPTLRFYAGRNASNQGEIGYVDVLTGAKTVIDTFAGYTNLGFGGKGNLSDDGNWVVICCNNPSGQWCYFTYNLDTRTKGADVVTGSSDTGQFATVSGSGTYVIYNNGSQDVTSVYDRATGTLLWTSEAANPTHYDWGRNQAGEEVICGRAAAKQLVMRRLSDGQLTVIGTNLACSHVSMRSTNLPGVAMLSGVYYGNWIGWNVMVTLESTPVVSPWNQTFDDVGTMPGHPYDTERHTSLSPDGTKAVFASTWNVSSNLPIQAYVAQV